MFVAMDKLRGDDLALACGVLQERYMACIKSSIVGDVLSSADVTAPTRKCGHLFTDITEYCAELVRTGAVKAPGAASKSRH
ncbi:hypothetical protein EON66_09625 [archaeon]|nr:MAG: hypothetical protein EON66_09625 [archaeon]